MAAVKKKNNKRTLKVVATATLLTCVLGIGALALDNNKLNERVTVLEQELETSENGIVALKSLVKEKESLIKSLKEENQTLSARIVELESEAEVNESEIVRLNKLIEDNNSTITTLRAEVNSLQNYVVTLESENSTLEDEKGSLQDSIARYESANAALQNNLTSMTSERDEYKALYEEYYTKYNDLLNSGESGGEEQPQTMDVSIWRALDVQFANANDIYDIDFYTISVDGEIVESCSIVNGGSVSRVKANYEQGYTINDDGSVTLDKVYNLNGHNLSDVVLDYVSFEAGEGESESFRYEYKGSLTYSDGSKQIQISVSPAKGTLMLILLDADYHQLGASVYSLNYDDEGNMLLGELVNSSLDNFEITSLVFGSDRILEAPVTCQYGEETLEFKYVEFDSFAYDTIPLE